MNNVNVLRVLTFIFNAEQIVFKSNSRELSVNRRMVFEISVNQENSLILFKVNNISTALFIFETNPTFQMIKTFHEMTIASPISFYQLLGMVS